MKSAATSMSTPQLRERRVAVFWTVWAVAAAFGSYFCMYAFRKPFTAASFSGTEVGHFEFKTILVTAQVAGYMVSKFIGIKVVSEMPPQRRALTMLWLILAAEGALVLFGVLPRPWNAVCLFLNGLPLGMVFGLVMGFLEGRRLTELLAAGLCASFILADGVVKSAGKWLLDMGIAEDWMPSAAGGLFLLPFGLCCAMLTVIPPPTSDDVLARNSRHTMTHDERRSFLSRYAFGLIPLVLMYLLVTIVRSIRADFAPEIWKGLGIDAEPQTFTNSEFFVMLGVLVVNGAVVLIADNRRAFFTALATYGLGFVLLAVALVAHSNNQLSPFAFMVMVGLGLYLPYVATHTTVFERLLGMTRERGNVGFLMYFADAIGYLGYVAVMMAKNYRLLRTDMLGLLTTICWVTVGLSAICLVVCWGYFSRVQSPEPVVIPAEAVVPTKAIV